MPYHHGLPTFVSVDRRPLLNSKKSIDVRIGESPTAYFYILCIAAFGFAIDYSFRWAQRKLCPWYYSE